MKRGIWYFKHCYKKRKCAQNVFNMGMPLCKNKRCSIWSYVSINNAYLQTVEAGSKSAS